MTAEKTIWLVSNDADPKFLRVIAGRFKPSQVCTFIYRVQSAISDESVIVARYDPDRVTVTTQSHGTYTAVPVDVITNLREIP